MATSYETSYANNTDRNNTTDTNITTVDDHFAFFKKVVNRASEYYVIQKAKNTYDSTKNSYPLIQRTLDQIETHAKDALNYSAPLYESFLFPATNRAFNAYNKGVETSKSAVDRTKEIAITSGTLGLGLVLVATQMGLIAGTTATNFFLDGLITTKNVGENAFEKAVDVEKYVQSRIQSAIKATFEMAKNPVEKLNEHANSFIDVAHSVFEQLLSLPKGEEDPESSLTERIAFLTRRVVRGITASANSQIVEPCQKQISGVLEQLQKSLVLVDYLKKQREWTFQQVDHLSSSVQEFRETVESEAKLALTKPEDVLIRSIHKSSKKLNESLIKLRESGTEILSETILQRLAATIDYIEQLDSNFVKAEDIYQVKENVLVEAKQKLQEISQWYK